MSGSSTVSVTGTIRTSNADVSNHLTTNSFLSSGLQTMHNADIPASFGSTAGPCMVTGHTVGSSGRFYIGDGSGWSYSFSKRNNSESTDLITINDSGNVVFTGPVTMITPLSHTTLANIGQNTHDQIDGHISSVSGHVWVGQDLRATASPTFAAITTTGLISGGSLALTTPYSHTSLSSVGTNTHVQIDSHISSLSGHTWVGQDLRSTANPTFAAITTTGLISGGSLALTTPYSHTSLSSVGTNTHTQIDSHISSNTGHLYVGQDLRTTASPTFAAITTTGLISGGSLTLTTPYSHTSLSNVGTNTHSQIDSHITSLSGHTWVGQDLRSTASPTFAAITTTGLISGGSLALTTPYSHTSLSNVGTNTHAQIDSHISNNSGHTWVGQDLRTTASPSFQRITTSTGANLANLRFYNHSDTSLPSGAGSLFHIVAGGPSSSIGKIYVGDGTGWSLHMSKRNSSVDTDMVTFKDDGTVKMSGTVNSTSNSTGTLTVTGGVGVGGSINANGVGFLNYYACDSSQTFGNGWDLRLSGRVLETGVLTSLYIPNTPAPAFGGITSYYSVRISGWIKPIYTETYTLELYADDTAVLYVNNTFMTSSSLNNATATISFTANQWYPIQIEWLNLGSPGSLRLRWSSTSQTLSDIPASSMCGDQLRAPPSSIGSTRVNGTLNTVGNIGILSTTESTAPTSGALTVSGGAGFGSSINVLGEITATSAGNNFVKVYGGSSHDVGAIFGENADKRYFAQVFYGQSNDSLNLQVSNGAAGLQPGLAVSTTRTSILQTASSSSKTTGALVVSGGVGVAGNLYANNMGVVNSSAVSTDPILSALQPGLNASAFTQISLGAAHSNNNAALVKFHNIGTGSASNYVDFGIWGTIGVSGGIRCIGDGTVQCISNAGSTSTTSGAFRVGGGVGIGENLYVGGNIYASGGLVSQNISFAGPWPSNPVAVKFKNHLGYISLTITNYIATRTLTGQNSIYAPAGSIPAGYLPSNTFIPIVVYDDAYIAGHAFIQDTGRIDIYKNDRSNYTGTSVGIPATTIGWLLGSI